MFATYTICKLTNNSFFIGGAKTQKLIVHSSKKYLISEYQNHLLTISNLRTVFTKLTDMVNPVALRARLLRNDALFPIGYHFHIPPFFCIAHEVYPIFLLLFLFI